MKIHEGDALIVVDMQNDFVTGSLAVPGASSIVPQVNGLIDKFWSSGLPVFYTACWHPEDHCSFVAQGGPWPPHCIANTRGADMVEGLRVVGTVIYKGTSSNKDAYSGFDGTTLHDYLNKRNVVRVLVCGLATDYCVKATSLDAVKNGYETVLILDAVKGVEVETGDVQAAQQEMWKQGVKARTVEWIRT